MLAAFLCTPRPPSHVAGYEARADSSLLRAPGLSKRLALLFPTSESGSEFTDRKLGISLLISNLSICFFLLAACLCQEGIGGVGGDDTEQLGTWRVLD